MGIAIENIHYLGDDLWLTLSKGRHLTSARQSIASRPRCLYTNRNIAIASKDQRSGAECMSRRLHVARNVTRGVEQALVAEHQADPVQLDGADLGRLVLVGAGSFVLGVLLVLDRREEAAAASRFIKSRMSCSALARSGAAIFSRKSGSLSSAWVLGLSAIVATKDGEGCGEEMGGR